MGRLVLSFLVFAQILLAQAMAARSDGTAEALLRTGDGAHVAGGGMTADPPSSSSGGNGGVTESWSEGEAESSGVAQPPGISRRLGRHRHSPDRSVAGGGVIIGGLVTVIFAAVYSYIRVTGRRAEDENALTR